MYVHANETFFAWTLTYRMCVDDYYQAYISFYVMRFFLSQFFKSTLI